MLQINLFMFSRMKEKQENVTNQTYIKIFRCFKRKSSNMYYKNFI